MGYLKLGITEDHLLVDLQTIAQFITERSLILKTKKQIGAPADLEEAV